ncbi:hypothetical protein EVAR_19067_1 [Eumeta japonica]|uniref:Uncharacterized protein n=1 Tax=Eumeta variegata TaxID=151549 RepID=A0A4C1UPF9_EUMVA|nr:hypothetical protein EVAR_19067_1 [Eumeta japonica]
MHHEFSQCFLFEIYDSTDSDMYCWFKDHEEDNSVVVIIDLLLVHSTFLISAAESKSCSSTFITAMAMVFEAQNN